MLTSLDLSNFNTKRVTDMRDMLSKCESLTNINLSNFNIQHNTDINNMFNACKSLKKENIIVYDNKILNQIKKDL